MSDLERVEVSTGAKPVGTVIWLHGLGADGWDFVPLVRELSLPAELPLRFVFPHAPERPVTINNGYMMRAWYDIAQQDLARVPDEPGIRESQQEVEALIAGEKERGIDSSRIVLAGFSQGGAIALQAGLRHGERLAGIMALSTYLPLEASLEAEHSPVNRRLPILMVHGTEDPVIPITLAETSQRTLAHRGYDVQWKSYPMAHSVCAEEVTDIAEFLVQVLGDAGDAAPRSSSILLAR
ncbi:MAG TPA: alpha/beta fold hydrolase [Usitatibacter sp.]|jgi:phospholipase/carboxylesterase|nr:alpha/beta fold hydrolase [Usitatibacter sp.]